MWVTLQPIVAMILGVFLGRLVAVILVYCIFCLHAVRSLEKSEQTSNNFYQMSVSLLDVIE